jgi:hypothetical protein
MKIEDARKIFGQLEAQRANYYQSCEKISKYTLPLRGNFAHNMERGKLIDHKKLLNSKVEEYINALAAGMMNGLTSPSLPWFEFETDNDGYETAAVGQDFLYRAKETIEKIFQRSNFYEAAYNVYKECPTFGTACVFIEKDFYNVCKYEFITFGNYYIGFGPGGIRIFGRRIKKNIEEIIGLFGRDRLTPAMKTAYENKSLTQQFEIFHLIKENPRHIEGAKENFKMKYASLYWADGDEYLKTSGYDYWPALTPRWETADNEQLYGTGPGWYALGDLKQLQKLQKDKLQAIGKIINPPILKSSSVSGPPDTSEGAINEVNGQIDAALKPLYLLNPDLRAIEYTIEQTLRSIKEKYYGDIFEIFTQDNIGKMLATEISARLNERMQKVGPVLSTLNREFLTQAIETTFYIAQQEGAIEQQPQELDGREITIKYISIVAQAQRARGLSALEEALNRYLAAAQANPEILQKIDFDKYGDIIADKLGAKIILKDDKELAAQRQAQARQAQAAQTAAAAQNVLAGAKAASEIKLGENSALDAVMRTPSATTPS